MHGGYGMSGNFAGPKRAGSPLLCRLNASTIFSGVAGTSSIQPGVATPALFTSTSTGPIAPSAAAKNRSIDDGSVAFRIGPLRREALSDRLPDPAGGIGLSRLLGTLVDELEVEDRDSGQWLLLEKRVS